MLLGPSGERGSEGSCCGSSGRPAESAIAPVCGMTVDPKAPAGGSLLIDGQPYYFCSTFCRANFTGTGVTKEADVGR